MNTKIFLFCKKIHRILVLVISTATVFMALTGLMLKYTSFFSKYFGFIDLGMIRYVHNNLSVYFTIVLVLMAVTGLYMYFFTLPKRSPINDMLASNVSEPDVETK